MAYYYCLRCGKKVEIVGERVVCLHCGRESRGLRCPDCNYRAFRKERPNVVKRVKAV
ncbi:MAG: hypothetical protein N2V73_04985 [Candidatus Methanospirare jalkutatii]|nr:hypothetical protein [Candidatus Methanospirare jalkutatii]